jgi:hypothetical protein
MPARRRQPGVAKEEILGQAQGRACRVGTPGNVSASSYSLCWQGCFGVLLVFSLFGSPAFAQQLGIELAWQDNSSNENGFRVERKLGEEGDYTPLAVVGPNVEGFADTAVSPDVTYCYRVKAFNGAGESGYTNEACAIPSHTVAFGGAISAGAGGAGGGTGGGGVAGAGAGGGGCFIATAAFGSVLAPEVQLLREVRDRYLLPHDLGRKAVQVYYALSPPLADVIGRSDALRGIVRFILVPLVGWAALALWSPTAGWSVPVVSCVVGVWLVGRRFRLH